jgi:TetR/AcrR family transcriptional regulator, mexJK operon transcriptional repressor
MNSEKKASPLLARSTAPSKREAVMPRPNGAQGPEAGVRARGRGRPRRGEADRLNEDLLTHALDHFLEKGFAGTTLNAITASLGMSKQTVYARYGDKLTLFRAALERAIDEWLVPLRNLHELEGDDVEESLVAVARAIENTLVSPTGVKLIRITNSESYRMPEIGEYTYRRGLQQIGVYLADFFRRRVFADGREVPDLDDLATTFLNLLSGPARLNAWGLKSEPIDVETFVRRRVQLFLHGILPAGTRKRERSRNGSRPA